MRRLGLADLRFQRRRIVEAAMHGAQDGGLGGEREMLELALVRVIRVADAARSRQAFDERRQRRQRTRCNARVWYGPTFTGPGRQPEAGQHTDGMRGVEHHVPAVAVARTTADGTRTPLRWD